MFKANKKKQQNDVKDGVLMFLLLTLNTLHTFSGFFIVYFEQVIVSW